MRVSEERSRKRTYDELYSFTSFVHLPDVVLLRIFEYLNIYDICKAAQVCHKWHDLSRSASLWKHVNVKNLASSQIIRIIPSLPPCVTHLRLNCSHIPVPLWLPGIMIKLNERCPSLKTFILDDLLLVKYLFDTNIENEHGKESDSQLIESLKLATLSEEDIQFCDSEYCNKRNIMDYCKILPELTVLSLRRIYCNYQHFIFYLNSSFLPKLNALDLTKTLGMTYETITMIPVLSQLKELYLAECLITDKGVENILKTATKLKLLDVELTKVSDSSMSVLKQYGHSLEVLYLGQTKITNFDITINDVGSFPQLQTLCVRNTAITVQNIKELFNLCPSLTHVYMTGNIFSKIENLSSGVEENLLIEEDPEFLYACEHFKKNHHFH